MIRIICTECKNAYLQNKDGNLVCPSCGATYDKEKENLLLGVQYYNEENYTEADNCFMKHIVKNSLEPLSIFYKNNKTNKCIQENRNRPIENKLVGYQWGEEKEERKIGV